MEKDNQQDIQITTIQTDIQWIKQDVSAIKDSIRVLETNCIPTIERKLSAFESNQKVLMAFMFCIVATLVGLFFK